MDNPIETPAPAKKARKKRTPAQLKSEMAGQRLRRSKALVKSAATLHEVERRCNGSSIVRDEHRQPILGPDGKVQRKPCGNAPIKGGTVCKFHGGNLPQVKAAAQRRLLAMVIPSLVRLNDLIHQDTHLATSLGAIRTVLERAGDEAIGALKKNTEDTSNRPQIIIGIKVGGIANPHVEVTNLPAAEPDESDDIEEGEIVGDD